MSRLEYLGKNIKKYREIKNLTQAELAEKLNFSVEYVCRVEKGQKYISLKKLFLLADILEVDLCEIINFK